MLIPREIKIESAVKAVTWAVGVTGVLAASEYVSWTYLFVFALLMALSARLDYRGTYFARWVYNVISIAVIALSVYRVSRTDIVVPALEALMTLMAVKFMQRKFFRDYMQIYAIAVFLLSGTALMSIGPGFLAWFFLLFFLISTAAVLLAHHTETLAEAPSGIPSGTQGFLMPVGDVYKIAARALLIPVAAVPLMAVVFFVLPRTNYQLLGFLNAKAGARSGFSSGVVLGDSSSIREDESVALRAVMPEMPNDAEGGAAAASGSRTPNDAGGRAANDAGGRTPIDAGGRTPLYWRGVALDTFDGRRWTRSPRSGPDKTPPPAPPGAATVTQTLYVEPNGENFLFALDRPVRISMLNSAGQNAIGQDAWGQNVTAGRDSVFTLTGPAGRTGRTTGSLGPPRYIDRKIKYRAVSIPRGITAEKNIDRRRYLQLPADIPGGISELAKNVTSGMNGGGMDDGAAAQALTDHLMSGRYAYSLTELPVSPAPLEEFLLKTRRGNCEYFASALAVMLRLRGIPSRLVGGYRGGVYNENGGYYIVSQKNAHVWVEAYIEPGNWVRYDPTSAPSAQLDTGAARRGFLSHLGMLADSFYFYWMELVINYDLERQVKLADNLRMNLKIDNLRFLVQWKEPVLRTLVSGAMMFAAFAAYRRLRRRKSAEMRLLDIFTGRLLRLGYARRLGHAGRPSQGLTEFAMEIKAEDIRSTAMQFAREFQRLYYKDLPFGEKDFKRLKELILTLP